MKQVLLEFLKRYESAISEAWSQQIIKNINGRLSESQVRTFVDSIIATVIEQIENRDYVLADQFLIDIYTLFVEEHLNLLEISQLFSQGRYSILEIIEKKNETNFDPITMLSSVDQVIEQLYARYGMLHQDAQMKEVQRDRDRLASKLELNQRYLKSILHSSDSAIMVVDNNEKFISWNKGAERIFGYTEEEILGKASSFLLPDGKKYSDELDQIKELTKNSHSTNFLETERKTKDGRILSVKLSVSKLPSSDGKYTGRSIIIKDFTEFKKLQAQIDQSEKLAVIGQLAAGVAHEIGNPLASISSLVQILQRKCEDSFLNEQLVHIKENIDRISKIVRELVDFSRPPSYELAIQDISDIIKTALGIVKYDKRVQNVKFENEIHPNMPTVNIAADQMLQVFINILINALDAIKGNGVISVKSYFDNKNIFIEISDDGIGMDKSILDKIFDPFFTTKEVGKGTGLGLSVSYGIIKKFKGEIEVQSIPEKGSTFKIILPIHA